MKIYNQIQQQPQQEVVIGKLTIYCEAAGGFGGWQRGDQTSVGRPRFGTGGNGGVGKSPENFGTGGGAGLSNGNNAGSGPNQFDGGYGVGFDGLAKITPDVVKSSGGNGGNGGAFGGGGGGSARGKRAGNGGNGAVRLKFNGKVQDYTTPGRYEFRVPEGVTSMEVICIGGGGSGNSDAQEDFLGGGGSGGGYSKNIVNVVPSTILQINVGSGGIAIDPNTEFRPDPGSRRARDGGASSVVSEISSPTPTPAPTPAPTPVPTPPPPIEEDVYPCEGEFNWCWKDIDFPIDGPYTIQFEADNIAELRIGGRFIERVTLENTRSPFTVNLSKGKKDICVKLTNIPINARSWQENPSAIGLVIKCKRAVEGDNASWKDNPLGISASLYSPPCPKESGGVGVVTSIYPVDPGNGYPPGSGSGPTYPVALVPSTFDITNPGLGFNLGDELIFDPPVEPRPVVCEVGPYGDVQKICFTPNPVSSLPRLVNTTGDGKNLEVVPRLNVIRDPLDVPPDKLIQVTDLVGLKQTGYVNGRAYYGAVFFKDGLQYAGFYETAGELIRVYDTLQESITARVTTQPDVIQRSGTDTRSNNPNLNIPGTPQSTTEA